MFLPSEVKVYIYDCNVAEFNTKELIEQCIILDGRSVEQIVEEVNNRLRSRFLYEPMGEYVLESMKLSIAYHLNEMESEGIIQRRNI